MSVLHRRVEFHVLVFIHAEVDVSLMVSRVRVSGNTQHCLARTIGVYHILVITDWHSSFTRIHVFVVIYSSAVDTGTLYFFFFINKRRVNTAQVLL